MLQIAFAAVLAVASAEVLVQTPTAILRQSQDVSPDGSYSYAYETDNGISHSETGSLVSVDARSAPVVVTQGQYQYISPEGIPISVSYVADQNGFQAQGEHIPQISPLIVRALEYIRAHPPQPESHILN